jgi:hypothetical protein
VPPETDQRCSHCKSKCRQVSDTAYGTKYVCLSCRRFTIISKKYAPEGITYRCMNHQGKAVALTDALDTKYTKVTEGRITFVLTDSDVMGRLGQLERMRQRGTRRFFVYPHSARPSMINDFHPVWSGTTAQFVATEYHGDVLRGYGYEKPLIPIGWHLSEVREFQPRERACKVLFAPIHPHNAPIDRDVNRRVFDRLYKLHADGGINLTVRYIGLLVDNGIPENAAGVRYIQGERNQTTHDMDKSDVVVSHQTYAWMAVARGVPCVMMAEDMPTHIRKRNQEYDNAPSWDKVSHLFRYPLDILAEDDVMGLLNRAVKSDAEIADWKRRMIGEPFEPTQFLESVERFL